MGGIRLLRPRHQVINHSNSSTRQTLQPYSFTFLFQPEIVLRHRRHHSPLLSTLSFTHPTTTSSHHHHPPPPIHPRSISRTSSLIRSSANFQIELTEISPLRRSRDCATIMESLTRKRGSRWGGMGNGGNGWGTDTLDAPKTRPGGRGQPVSRR